MASNKNFTEKRMVLTSHFLQSRKIAKKIESIPDERRTLDQKRLLSNLSDEERGIITIGDVHEERARAAAEKAAGETSDAERAAAAEAIAEQKRKEAAAAAEKAKTSTKKAPAKTAPKGAKSGSKKKS